MREDSEKEIVSVEFIKKEMKSKAFCEEKSKTRVKHVGLRYIKKGEKT